ncbi:glutaminase [Rhodoligotrophos ferricapiens]|uniref:glutaminase n=1 Tax=Rhodoligotrophos ferricapiens TaxID=3069264 RepID=UPI00315D03DE
MLDDVLRTVAEEVKPQFGRGKVADYIPALARVRSDHFGMCVVDVAAREASVGEASEPFSIQSIAKVFALMLALRVHGHDIWTRVGKEPSGSRFDSLVQLEYEGGWPRNPFINAGALVVVDSLMRRHRRGADRVVLDYVRVLAQNFTIEIDEDVARSELATAHRNAAIAHLLKSHGTIDNDPLQVLEAYCRICALRMSCLDLARAFLPLACRGYSPALGEDVMTEQQARRVNAIMMTCGMYDAVGSFAFRVGLPAKSGVGGGIIAIAPGHSAIAVWSPELDRSGNSLVGTAALEAFVHLTKVSAM